MDGLQTRVLDVIQSGFPLQGDPYGVIGGQLGAARDDVLAAVAALRREGSIRRLGASFNSQKLGYSSTLCALAVAGAPEDVDRAAAIVNAYPNVTHNYLRNNRYNLWFTIIARGADEVARILAEIQRDTGCPDALNLPATALYKIRVDFSDMKKGDHAGRGKGPGQKRHGHAEATDAAPVRAFDADDPLDVALVRWAQEDIAGAGELPDAEPFATAAARIAAELGDAGIDEQRVLERLRDFKAAGVIRRFGALVAHRKMGFAFNGMTVWDVPADELDEQGRAFAAKPYVSHCYARPRSDDWPYNLYAMIHAKTDDELDERVAELERESGRRAQVLVSSREYKKSSMRYFV